MKLKYLVGKTVSAGYGDTKEVLRKISLVDMVIGFKHRMRNLSKAKRYRNSQEDLMVELNLMSGGISPKIRVGKQIMMMDVDHQDFKNEIIDHLGELGIAHSVIESSEGHYWIIADKFKANRYEMAKYQKQFINVDPKYLEYSREAGFNLRSYPRNGYAPQVIQENGGGSRAYRAYMKAWKAYWKLPHIKWMNQEFLMNVI